MASNNRWKRSAWAAVLFAVVLPLGAFLLPSHEMADALVALGGLLQMVGTGWLLLMITARARKHEKWLRTLQIGGTADGDGTGQVSIHDSTVEQRTKLDQNQAKLEAEVARLGSRVSREKDATDAKAEAKERRSREDAVEGAHNEKRALALLLAGILYASVAAYLARLFP